MVSGSGGFIGSVLVRRIKNHNVYELRHAKQFAKKRNKFYLDLTNPNHVDKLIIQINKPIKVFFHLAAFTPYTNPTKKINFSEELKIAKGVKKICSKLSVHKFIFSSGWVVYSPKAKIPISETAALKPCTDYGKSKLKLERFFLKNLKVPQVVILRISSVYGPGQEAVGLIPTLVQSAFKTKELKIESEAIKRDYLYIDDLIEIFKSLIYLKSAKNLILNIGSGKSSNIKKITGIIQDLLNRHFKIYPKIIVKNSTTNNIPTDNLLNISKARKILKLGKFQSLNSGLHSYLRWYKSKR